MLIVARETFEAALKVTLGPKAADHLIKGVFKAVILSACEFDFIHAPYQPSSVGWARGTTSVGLLEYLDDSKILANQHHVL